MHAINLKNNRVPPGKSALRYDFVCILNYVLNHAVNSVAMILLVSWGVAAEPTGRQHCKMNELVTQQGQWLVGTGPKIDLWVPRREDQWQPPACIPWMEKPARVVVSTSGRFEHNGSTDGLLALFAGVSDMTTIQYWSVTRQRWKPLFKQSHAFDSVSNQQRSDFELGELKPGNVVQVQQKEAYLPAPLTMQWEILERTPDRLVIVMSNANAVKWMFSRVIGAGDYEFFYLLEREKGSTWRFYNVSRLVGGHIILSLPPKESYINRAAAIFRYISGQPTDMEPPAAPTRQ